MAKVFDLVNGWATWRDSRLPVVQEMIESHPPNLLYQIMNYEDGHRCMIYSYHEDRTVTVTVDKRYNHVFFTRRVFGIKISDLEECDLPGPDDPVGDLAADAGYTNEDIENILIPKVRQALDITPHKDS